MVAFAAPDNPATYQVTPSGEGWIDVVQDGKVFDSLAYSGAKKCSGPRKSVRFAVGTAPVTLQVSGAPGDSIKVAIRPVE